MSKDSVFHIFLKHYVWCIASLLEAQNLPQCKLLEDTVPGSNRQRSFNPLEQFFNTVYTRDFLVQILFTQDKNNTGRNYLSLISAKKESKPKSLRGFLSFKLTRRGLIKDTFAACCTASFKATITLISVQQNNTHSTLCFRLRYSRDWIAQFVSLLLLSHQNNSRAL